MRRTGGGIRFAKFSGAGNDFVLLDARLGPLPRPLGPWVRAVCQRGVSVGADGVLVVEKARRGSLQVGFYNPDGRRHEFCGNGSRCVARWEALRRGRAGEVVLDTDAGRVRALVRGSLVGSGLAFPLGAPRLLSVRVDGRPVRGYLVTAGVPHFVLLRGVPDDRPLPALAAKLRRHPVFPRGANVDFVGAARAGVRPIRTFERGVEGETLACGTGCVAAALVLALRDARLRSPARFRVRSGARIDIRFQRRGGRLEDLRLCGEARLVYSGALSREALRLPGRDR
jgi:diaminopimelate epimerase